MDAFDAIAAQIDSLTGSGAYLAGGVARIGPEGDERAHVAGRVAPGGPPMTDPELRMRMASISKMATAKALVLAGGEGHAVTDLLPEMPLPGVTVTHLLTHTSGLTDRAGYVVEPPGSVADHISRHPAALSGRVPGAFFRYCNLGYVVAGMALELLTGQRFNDAVRTRVLEPAGVRGGFNWCGATDRRPLPMYQRRHGALTLEADGPELNWDADLIWAHGRGVTLDLYVPGRDTTWFSPHAGLRMSVVEAARLVRFCATDAAPHWIFDGTNGEDCGGLFTAFGVGLSIYRDHPRLRSHLVGHAGHALGFTGGAWSNRETGAAWAYFLTGSPDLTEGQDEEAFFAPEEAAIMAGL